MNRLRNIARTAAAVYLGFPFVVSTFWIMGAAGWCGQGTRRYAGAPWTCGHTLFADIGAFLKVWFTPVRWLVQSLMP
jgi:hypothetical protein